MWRELVTRSVTIPTHTGDEYAIVDFLWSRFDNDDGVYFRSVYFGGHVLDVYHHRLLPLPEGGPDV